MDKDGENGTIINGMACQAKIIVDNERVLVHLLKEIELWDQRCGNKMKKRKKKTVIILTVSMEQQNYIFDN